MTAQVVVAFVTPDTAEICAIYLVGRFSGHANNGTRHHTPPLDIFRADYQAPFAKMCADAEAGDSKAISALSGVITN
jgi:hypothetical protein